MTTLESALEIALQLSPVDKVRLLERIAAALEFDLAAPPTPKAQQPTSADWHTALRATYGILADIPMDRPVQPSLEERDPLE